MASEGTHIFCFVYKHRSQWLANNGIFLSWSVFSGFMKEQHAHPKVPDEDYMRFRAWLKSAELEEQDMKTIYRKILDQCRDDKKQFVCGLLRYFDSGDFLEFTEGEFREGQADRFAKAIEDATGFKKSASTNSVKWLNSLLKEKAFAQKLIDMAKSKQLSLDASELIEEGNINPQRIRSILEVAFPQEAPRKLNALDEYS
jgi:hypothetical protein